MKISILLPYKENFTVNKSGAVSLFVKDLINNKKKTNLIKVYGDTEEKKFLNKNYVNLNIKKKFFRSTSNTYIDKFLLHEKKFSSDIIEIHNRPSYVAKIKKSTKSKIILFFHNDPLSMNGSKTIDERNYLLKNIDHFIFNSKWSLSRFKINLKNFNVYKNKFSVVYQCVSKKKINFKKKKKVISFIGKLNSAKGYDVFGKSIIKILNKFPDWHSFVIGDEPREKIIVNHKNLVNYGYRDQKFILRKLEKTSISVICSRWDEPFGRASVEACSRGSVPIITNKGGLPETTKYPIIINQLSEAVLTQKIEKLIKNKKLLEDLQIKNYKNFNFTPQLITKEIEKIRENLFFNNKTNINFNKKNIKILHITNFNERYNGRLHYNTGRRINNGFIRNNHSVFALSDRDIIHSSKSITDLQGIRSLNKRIIDIVPVFNPDLIILGHADNVKAETLAYLKEKNKNLHIGQWFLDPVSRKGPDYIKNKHRLTSKAKHADFSFITTSPDVLDFKLKNSFYIPNPSDTSFEILNNFEKDQPFDLFFAMSHGVHRGVLKKGKSDNRELFLSKIIKKAENQIEFDFYGFGEKQPVWGKEFLDKIANSKMGLNLSRGVPLKYYSSDRISQLFGNGLLTFIDKKTKLDNFFNSNEAVFYKNVDDLIEKILKYKKDNIKRKLIAKNGKLKYMKYFNSDLVSQFMIDKIFDFKSKNKYIWN